MKKPKKRHFPASKSPHPVFDFVSVGLAAASGRLSMEMWAEYLESLRPAPKRKPKRRAEAEAGAGGEAKRSTSSSKAPSRRTSRR